MRSRQVTIFIILNIAVPVFTALALPFFALSDYAVVSDRELVNRLIVIGASAFLLLWCYNFWIYKKRKAITLPLLLFIMIIQTIGAGTAFILSFYLAIGRTIILFD